MTAIDHVGHPRPVGRYRGAGGGAATRAAADNRAGRAAGGGLQVQLTIGADVDEGLPARKPVEDPASYGGGVFDWLPSGEALVYVGTDGELYLQPAAGGPPRPVVSGGSGGGATAGPAVSPDGTRVAYVVDGRHVAIAWLAEDGPWPVRLST